MSFLNGLSALGSGVAQFAGTAAVEAQKAQLMQQQTILADQLATTRETGLQASGGVIAAAAAEKAQAAQAANIATEQTGANTRSAANNATSIATTGMSVAGTAANTRATIAGELQRTQIEAGKPTGELQMARALAGPNPTQDQFSDALITVLSGRAKFTNTPTTQVDPNDPSKTISGINVFNTRTGESEFRQTDTNPNKPGAAGAGQGNRAELQFNRITAAGNAASKAVENIMELPATTSTGWFAGAGQGTGIMSAVKNVLTNTVTSQDVQSFKVMATGVGRNMATLETQGLAPPQGFAKSMESTMLAEGDTQETKLRKMAEMRQIIQANLEPSLQNPKIPPEQKALVSQIINKVTTAIPFTQHDITMLSQSKSGATMADVMRAKGLGGGSAATDAPAPAAAVPSWVKPGDQYSPSRGQARGSDGTIYGQPQ